MESTIGAVKMQAHRTQRTVAVFTGFLRLCEDGHF
jgi:hypothetical protein